MNKDQEVIFRGQKGKVIGVDGKGRFNVEINDLPVIYESIPITELTRC